MASTLADFPPDRFAIHAYCECGHSARVGADRLPADMQIQWLRSRLRCGACGSRQVSIRIEWTAAGGYKYSAV